MGDVIHMKKNPAVNEGVRDGMPFVKNGMLHVPMWYPVGDARCIEPGCTAMTPEQDPLGFFTCGDRHHRTSDGRPRVLSRVVDLRALPDLPAPARTVLDRPHSMRPTEKRNSRGRRRGAK